MYYFLSGENQQEKCDWMAGADSKDPVWSPAFVCSSEQKIVRTRKIRSEDTSLWEMYSNNEFIVFFLLTQSSRFYSLA